MAVFLKKPSPPSRSVRSRRAGGWAGVVVALGCAIQLLASPHPARGQTAAVEQPRFQRILVLHSGHEGYAWTDSIMGGIDGVLSAAHADLTVWVEYLDARRQRGSAHFQNVYELLGHKLKGRTVDLVMTSDEEALDFALAYRDELFAGAPIVFCGIDPYAALGVEDIPGVTGVVEATDFRASLDAAFVQHPDTRRIVVLSPALINRQLIEPLVADYRPDVDLEIWTEERLESIEQRLTGLPEDSVIVPISEPWTEEDMRVPFDVFLTRLAEHSDAPIYTVWDFALGHGIVGGRLVSGASQGKKAAQLALRVLSGAPVDAIGPIIDTSARFLFDYEQLSRFGIPEASLPPGSTVINRPRSFYETHRVVLWSGAAIVLALSTFIAVLLRNISNRRLAEVALREEEQRFRDYANTAADFFWEMDAELRVTFVSDGFEEATGVTPERVLGRTRDELLTDFVVEGETLKHHFASSRRDRPYRNQELTWRRPDGELRFLRHSGKPLLDANDRLRGYRGTVTDITEQKSAEAALRDSEQRLMEQQRREKVSVERQLAEVQDELVRQTRFAAIGQVAASIAHDLRNPLGAIRNAKFYLSRRVPEDKPKWREYLRIIEQEIVSADHIINELMDMSRARAPEKRKIDLGATLGEVQRRVNGSTPCRMSYEFEFEPYEVHADPDQLVRVFDNLVSNAMQATGGDGHIVIRARVVGDTDEITVDDDGPGVSGELRDRIFEPLVTDKAKGTGLGLAICRQLVEGHGGRIELVTPTQGGASFRFWLPRPTMQTPMSTH